MNRRVDIIGAGLSGLYAAAYLSKQGADVRVFEKNAEIGGRSRSFQTQGFKFDMGPSWYWMPELVDQLFNDLGENRKEYFSLKHLSPAYKVFWKDKNPTEVPASLKELYSLFDSFEKEGGEKLKQFLVDAKIKYEIATADFMENPGLKWREVFNFKALKNAIKLDVFKSVEKDVASRFSSDQARAILNFPVLFLGEMPSRIPSLYTLMNYVDLELGTWYPEGGMDAIAKALAKIAIKNGAKIYTNSAIDEFKIENDKIKKIKVNDEWIETSHVLASADYNFIEQKLLPEKYKKYSANYWDKRKLAPSCLIFYIGLNKKTKNLLHHNLFFDEDLNEHGKSIYNQPAWPEKPLFYACVPSLTDENVAPDGHENLFLLMPIACDIIDDEAIREKYLNIMLARLEKHMGDDISSNIVYKRSYAIHDFKKDYNAFKGNAYGLANTLKQTANLKPKINSKIKNLNYCGQLTVPGPGIPPAMISGKVVAKEILKNYEKTV